MLLLALLSASLAAPDPCADAIPDDEWFADNAQAVLRLHKSILDLSTAASAAEANSSHSILSEGNNFLGLIAHLRDLAEFSRTKQVRKRAIELFRHALRGDPLRFPISAINMERSQLKMPALVTDSGRLRDIIEESRRTLLACTE